MRINKNFLELNVVYKNFLLVINEFIKLDISLLFLSYHFWIEFLNHIFRTLFFLNNLQFYYWLLCYYFYTKSPSHSS